MVNSFHFDEFYLQQNHKKKNRETLFTFEVHNAELLSFDDFFSQKIPNFNSRHPAAILGYIETKVDPFS